jgi:hypothetical protein
MFAVRYAAQDFFFWKIGGQEQGIDTRHHNLFYRSLSEFHYPAYHFPLVSFERIMSFALKVVFLKKLFEIVRYVHFYRTVPLGNKP